MSSIRLSGTSSGYYDLTVPAAAGTNSIDLSALPVKDSSGNLAITGQLGINTTGTGVSGQYGTGITVRRAVPEVHLQRDDGNGNGGILMDNASATKRLFVGTYNGSSETHIGTNGTQRLIVSTDGHVTTPNQPIVSLQPDTSSNVTTASSSDHIVGWKTVGGRQTLLRSGLTLSAASGTTIANGGSTGRITFSTGGVYYIDCTIRMENTPGQGNLKINFNGSTIHRMHVEAWGRYNYAHGWVSRCVTASANDYVEFIVAAPSGTFSGSNDTVNWLTIMKVA